MTFLWEVKLYQTKDGYHVFIGGSGKSAQGDGPTPYQAYRIAESKLVVKPAFFIDPNSL